MKKTLVLALCLLIAVFAFTSCNNDTRVPENENGNTQGGTDSQGGSGSQEDSGWKIDPAIYGRFQEVNDKETKDEVVFGEDGYYTFHSANIERDPVQYTMRDGYVYSITDVTAGNSTFSIDNETGILTITAKTEYGTQITDFKYKDGTPDSIIGTWETIEESTGQNSVFAVMKITETTMTNTMYNGGIVNMEMITSYTLDGNTILGGTGTVKLLVFKYDSVTDSLLVNGSENYQRISK